MLKTILNTFAAKVLTTIFLFILVLMTTHTFGAEGRGVISLITASIGIINLVNGFVGGSALVYIWPKNKKIDFYKKLIIICISWGIITTIFSSLILVYFNSFSPAYFNYVIILGFASSITFSLSMILIGDGNVNNYNLINLGQAFLNIVIFGLFIWVLNYKNINSYLISISLSNIIVLILSIKYIKDIKPTKDNYERIKYKTIIKQIVKYGFVSQSGNLLQFFNYRLSFFILNNFLGKAVVGKYSIAVQLVENIALISSSIALVQYSKIVNIENDQESMDLTLRLIKFSVAVTSVCILVLLMIPASLFTVIFGKDFTSIKNIIYVLAPGMIFYSFFVVISQYFAGKGLYYLNLIGSALSLIVTILGNYLFVKNYGYYGAGLTSTAAYLTLFIFFLLLFLKRSNFKIKDFFITSNDVNFIKNKIRFKFGSK